MRSKWRREERSRKRSGYEFLTITLLSSWLFLVALEQRTFDHVRQVHLKRGEVVVQSERSRMNSNHPQARSVCNFLLWNSCHLLTNLSRIRPLSNAMPEIARIGAFVKVVCVICGCKEVLDCSTFSPPHKTNPAARNSDIQELIIRVDETDRGALV